MKRWVLFLLIPVIIPLFRAYSEDTLQSDTLKKSNICHNPKLGQTVTVDMEYTSYTGVVSELSEDGIIVSTDPERITHILIQTSQIKGIYC
ncbi:MAG: hypothetical protein RJB24_445 [Candidatus Parcubacteria bacterium]|jgi:hypothetical protein